MSSFNIFQVRKNYNQEFHSYQEQHGIVNENRNLWEGKPQKSINTCKNSEQCLYPSQRLGRGGMSQFSLRRRDAEKQKFCVLCAFAREIFTEIAKAACAFGKVLLMLSGQSACFRHLLIFSELVFPHCPVMIP
jgi:hypothetical protein